MSHLRSVIHMTWNTTPAQLRALADKMEREWPLLRPGDSIEVTTFISDNGDTLHIHHDQDAMRKEVKQ